MRTRHPMKENRDFIKEFEDRLTTFTRQELERIADLADFELQDRDYRGDE